MASKILIIEDDADLRRNLQQLLESESYVVEAAENGRDALNRLEAATDLPKLIILDLMMPVMDGFQFRIEQAKNDRFASIPVIVMTADGKLEEKKSRAGASGALRKPADVSDILDLVEQLLA